MFPLKSFLEKTGGIPVDRFRANNIVEDTMELFEKSDQMYLVLSPEGTRAYVEKWRSGFYQIALGAKVPLLLGYIDFGRKVAGIGPAKELTGDKETDFQMLREFYKNVTPCHQDNWCPDFE